MKDLFFCGVPFAYCTPQIKHQCRQKRRETRDKRCQKSSFLSFFMFNLPLIGLTKTPQGRFLLAAVARRDGYLSPPLLLFCLWFGGGGFPTTMERRRNPFSSSLQMGKRKEGFLPYASTSLWVAEERVGSNSR